MIGFADKLKDGEVVMDEFAEQPLNRQQRRAALSNKGRAFDKDALTTQAGGGVKPAPVSTRKNFTTRKV